MISEENRKNLKTKFKWVRKKREMIIKGKSGILNKENKGCICESEK